MAWFEVKKINKNFLKETLDSKIKTIGSKLFSSIKSIEDVIVQYTNNISSTKTAVWKKQVIYTGVDTLINIEVSGKGSAEVYLLGAINGSGSQLSTQYINLPAISVYRISIDGVQLSGPPYSVQTPLVFNNSLKITNLSTEIRSVFAPSYYYISNLVSDKKLPYIVVITLDE